jgi:hypothetical protein
MTEPDYARLAARVLAAGERSAAPPSLGDRAAAVDAVARALARRSRRGRRVWLAVGATAALAAAATAAAALLAPAGGTVAPAPGASATRATGLDITARAEAEPGATLAREGMTTALGPTARLRPGDALRAAAGGEISVSLSTGTRLGLGGGGNLEVASLGSLQQFALREGRLRAQVAKLGAGQRFVVATADAEVEVRGTSFEVAVVAPDPAWGDRSTTRVRVFEGVVAVRSEGREARVGAGEVWSSRREPGRAAAGHAAVWPALRRGSTAHPAHARTAFARPVTALPSAQAPAASEAAASTLAEQNEIYARALEARRRGDTREALERLDDLLARHPSSPLAESARSERRRLLGAGGERGGTP